MDDLALPSEKASVNADTLPATLQSHAMLRPQTTALSYLSFSATSEETQSLTFSELDASAQKVAAVLLRLAAPGTRAVLVYPSGVNFVTTFLGCLYAGIIAVPVAPPVGGRCHHAMAIANDCTASLMLCADEYLPVVTSVCPAHCTVVAQSMIDDETLQLTFQCKIAPASIAFLQYTSGSTTQPRGVTVTHAALASNLMQLRSAFKMDVNSVAVHWLPLHHDMGLIGSVLAPLFCGFHAVVMSPLSFIQRPERWLYAIERFRGTVCGAPTFAYRHCLARMTKKTSSRIDLSSWSVAFCGAEPVHAGTLHSFAQAFAENGFRADSFVPCYGLAEATLFVSGAPLRRGLRAIRFDADDLDRGLAQASTNDTARARELVSCGVAVSGTKIVVTDRSGCAVDEGMVGEIRVSGPAVTHGYWNRGSSSVLLTRIRDAGDDLFLHTGDLGFIYQGELYITGRIKDLIIIDGRNITPEDLEISAMEACPEVLAAAAFAINDEAGERIAMLVEVRNRRFPAQVSELLRTVRDAVTARHAIPLAVLLAVRPASLPRTTSGKLSRRLCREAYQNNTLLCTSVDGPETGRASPLQASPWILAQATLCAPSLRLYCFPYGGGGASAFWGWKQFFDSSIEICPVQLPGRETRSREQPLARIDNLLRFFQETIALHGATTFAFFGYSLGARLAFAVARYLRRKGLPLPCTMCLAAIQEPGTASLNNIPLYQLSDAALLDTLDDALGPAWIPPRVRADRLVLERILALVRSDSELGESIEFADEPPFDFPLTVLGGRDDKMVRAEDLVRWHVHSTGSFHLHLLEGSHAIIHTRQETIAKMVASGLKPFIQT